jgi:hypothetical protein
VVTVPVDKSTPDPVTEYINLNVTDPVVKFVCDPVGRIFAAPVVATVPVFKLTLLPVTPTTSATLTVPVVKSNVTSSNYCTCSCRNSN